MTNLKQPIVITLNHEPLSHSFNAIAVLASLKAEKVQKVPSHHSFSVIIETGIVINGNVCCYLIY